MLAWSAAFLALFGAVALADTLIGTDAADTIPGTPRPDQLYGEAGDDRILAGRGNDYVEGGPGKDDLAAGAGAVDEVRPLVEAYRYGDRTLHLLARGRVVNLAAAEGHPAAVMDVSFAIQALCVEELVRRAGELEPAVHAVPAAIDAEVASLKLAALGAEIDDLTDDQREYLDSWT